MSKNKAESINFKTKSTNGILKQTSKISKSKNEENKKTKELNTERSNLNKIVASSSNTSARKFDTKDISKCRTTNKSITNNSGTRTALKPNDKQTVSSIAPKINPQKSSIKSVKQQKTSSSSSGNSSKNTSSIPAKGTKLSSRDITSKRVTKELYFPKKYPFSSYLHDNSDKEKNKSIKETLTVVKDSENNVEQKMSTKLKRERTKTRILTKDEVKIIKDMVQEKDNSKTSNDRPRTATIKKHDKNDEKNNEIKNIESEVNENPLNDSNNEYEDDFESYESDFEPYSSSSITTSENESIETSTISSDGNISTSTSEQLIELTQKRTKSAGIEDEKKLDSGNYDMPDTKHKQILDKIKEAVEKENLNLNETVNLASLSDEGFEDGSKNSIVNTGFINFAVAMKKQQQKKLHLKQRKRGKDLLGMIRLDHVSISLFDMKSISYEDFIKYYGKTGTIQTSSQTGDDDVDEEIQTDVIDTVDKSVQFPIRFSKNEEFAEKQFIDENINKKELNKFFRKMGNLILRLLEEKESKEQEIIKTKRDLIFSKEYFELNLHNFVKSRSVKSIAYAKDSKLLTVHESNTQVYMDKNSQLLSRPLICVWNILKPSAPLHILVSSAEITTACCNDKQGYLVFAGLNDGSICVWDLRETFDLHRNVYEEDSDKFYLMRSPTYITVPIIKAEPNAMKITAIKSYYTKSNDNTNIIDSVQITTGVQIVTLTETGVLVILNVVEKQTSAAVSKYQDIISWGCILLEQGLVIHLEKLSPNLKELQCYDLHFFETDVNHMYIASNYGVLHCLKNGMKPKPKLYCTDKSSVTCIEIIPFTPQFFLSGCENGNIKLYSRFYEKPLMTLCSIEEENNKTGNIEIIKWLECKPCVFFAKDKANYIHIWDLTKSDLYPIYSIPFPENISDMKFMSCSNKSNQRYYLAIASKDYGVRIHVLSNEFSQLTSEEYATELNVLFNYINRL